MTWSQPLFGGMAQELAMGGARSGMVDYFVAPENTAHTAPIGQIGAWQYFGVVKEGSPKNDITRRYYDLMTGAPKTMKDSFVTGAEATFDFSLIEPSALAIATAAGHGGRTPQYRETPIATTTAASGSTEETLVLTAVDDEIVEGAELAVVVGTTEEYTRVIGVEGTSVHVWPILSAVPASGAAVKLIDGWMTRFGTSVVQKVALMSVFTDRNGNQIVTWTKKARSEGFSEDYADGEKEMIIPLKFKAFGYAESGVTGPVVTVRYDFKPALALSYDSPVS